MAQQTFHSRNKCTIPFGFLLIFFTTFSSCNNHDKTTLHNSNTLENTSSAPAPPESNIASSSPSFASTAEPNPLHGPHSITRNVLQDKNGIIWLATWEGIISYDGKQFTNLTLKEGLKQIHVFSILEDKAGNLWFGTIGDGVIRKTTGESNSVTYFTTAEGLTGNTVLCMVEDMAGNIWMGTDNGVSRYNPHLTASFGRGNAFTNFNVNDGLSSNFILSLVQDKTGKLWIGSRGGIDIYNSSATLHPGDKLFTPFSIRQGITFHNVHSMINDRKGMVWIASDEGLYSYDARLTSFDGTTGTNHSITAKLPVLVSKDIAFNLFEDRTGKIWLSDGELNSKEMTLSKYDGKTFTKIKNDKQIFGIGEDSGGNIWFGTANGVVRYDVQSARTYQHNFTEFR